MADAPEFLRGFVNGFVVGFVLAWIAFSYLQRRARGEEGVEQETAAGEAAPATNQPADPTRPRTQPVLNDSRLQRTTNAFVR